MSNPSAAPGHARTFEIRPLEPEDRAWANGVLVRHWGSTALFTRGRVYAGERLAGFVAWRGGDRVGLVTYAVDNAECEITSLNSLVQEQGIGTALIESVRQVAESNGCDRLCLITTNDNLHALGFYQKRGFQFAALHRGAVDESRKHKPEIPISGKNGIPIRDELELEVRLR